MTLDDNLDDVITTVIIVTILLFYRFSLQIFGLASHIFIGIWVSSHMFIHIWVSEPYVY